LRGRGVAIVSIFKVNSFGFFDVDGWLYVSIWVEVTTSWIRVLAPESLHIYFCVDEPTDRIRFLEIFVDFRARCVCRKTGEIPTELFIV
jgi:hypothetical protein